MKRAAELSPGDRIYWGPRALTVESARVFKSGLFVMIRTAEGVMWTEPAFATHEEAA